MDPQDADTPGALTRVGNSVIDRLLRTGINGIGPLKSADDCAREALAKGRTPEQAIRSLIRTHVAMAGAQGFVLNLGGVVTTVVALPANIGAAYVIQTRLAAAIARVYDHDLDTEEVRTAILLCLLGNNAAEVVKQVGVKVGRQLTAKLIKQVPIRFMREINKKVGFRLLTKVGESGAVVLTKGIPVVGGVIGGGFDAAATLAVGEFARRFLSPEGIRAAPEGSEGETRRRWPRQQFSALRVTLDRKFRKSDPVDLTKLAASPDVVDVRIGWTSVAVDVDVSAFICGLNGRVGSDQDFVYFNNRSSSDESVRLTDIGADAPVDGIRSVFTVNLAAMPGAVQSVVFAMSVYEDRSTFDGVDDIFIQVLDQAGVAEPVSCDLAGEFAVDTAVVVGELHRTARGWEFREIGEGYPGGLASIAKHHGVNV